MSTFWVYENWTHDRARIHQASCTFCDSGRGLHADTSNRNGQWLPFETIEDARRSEAMRTRSDASECGVCIR